MEGRREFASQGGSRVTYYAIRTSPQREFALAGSFNSDGEWIDGILERKGFEVFCPTEGHHRRTKRGKGPRRVYMRPMFPRYIFAKAANPHLLRIADRHIAGVVSYADGTPAPIPDHEIVKLKAMSGRIVPDASIKRRPRPGEMAKITAGPFQGQLVKVEGLHGRRARIFMNLFGARKEVQISAEQLEVA